MMLSLGLRSVMEADVKEFAWEQHFCLDWETLYNTYTSMLSDGYNRRNAINAVINSRDLLWFCLQARL